LGKPSTDRAARGVGIKILVPRERKQAKHNVHQCRNSRSERTDPPWRRKDHLHRGTPPARKRQTEESLIGQLGGRRHGRHTGTDSSLLRWEEKRGQQGGSTGRLRISRPRADSSLYKIAESAE